MDRWSVDLLNIKNNRIRNKDVFGSFTDAIDVDYNGQDVTFKRYVHKLKTTEFIVVKRNAYGRGVNYMKEIIEYRRKNCYIQSSGMCFLKCMKYFTDKNYTDEFRDFIRNEKYCSGVRTSIRIQPFCEKYHTNIGCFDGTRRNPRNMTQRNISLLKYNINLCSTLKPYGFSFNQAIG